MSRVIPAFLVCGLALSAFSDEAPAPSQEKPPVAKPAADPVRLPEIVVTPTRREADPFEVPYSVGAFGADRLHSERPARQITDALGEVPGVMLQKTSYGQSSPFIRGHTGYRTLMLVDGVRLNNSAFRPGPNQYWSLVDPLAVSRLELVKGPGSVLYGSDAVGGTVNALSTVRDPRDGGGWERRVYLRFSDAEHSNIERLELSGLPTDRLGVHLGVSRKDFGDLEAGRPTGRQEYTGYDEEDWDGALVYRFNPDTSLRLVHQRVRQTDVPRTHSTIYAESFHGTQVGGDLLRELDQLRELTYLRLETENAQTFFDHGIFTLSWQEQFEQQDRIQTNALDVQGFTVQTLGASVQFATPSPWGHFTYGAEFYHDEIDSFRGNFNAAGATLRWRPRGPVADDAGYDMLGIYAQDELTLRERWVLTLGSRYDRVTADLQNVADPFDSLSSVKNADAVHERWESVIGNARLMYRMTPETHPYVGLAQGFRAPSVADLSQFDAARSGEVNVPSPDLSPERFLVKELGVKHRDARWTWEAAYYHTEIDNQIERAPTGELSGANRVVKRVNSGRGFIQGVEIEVSVRPVEDWLLYGNTAWQEGNVDTFVTSAPEQQDMRPASRIAPVKSLLGARWTVSAERQAWVDARAEVVDKQDRISPDDALDIQRIPPGGTPGYSVFSLSGGMAIRPGTSVTLGVENLADKNYRVLGSGTNSPGRNAYVVFDTRF